MDMTYIPSRTIEKFHNDNTFVRGIMGPIGSGKSVGCVIELLLRATAHPADADGVRDTKWAVIRNTYRELLDTTVTTFFTWIPRSWGVFSETHMTFELSKKLPDGTTLKAMFLFRALDRPKDVKKLLSLDITGAWGNEARELPKDVIDMLQGRVGRYPPKITMEEEFWHGLILDTNPPDNSHWWYTVFEVDRPETFKLFRQPDAMSKDAENIDNLPATYYSNLIAGKRDEWVNVYVHGNYGFVSDGKPVYPEYNDRLHFNETVIYNPKMPLYLGIDFGLTPACSFIQPTATGGVHIIDELCTFDMGAKNFAKILKQKLLTEYRASADTVEVYGDPAGDTRAQTDEQTPYMMLQAEGITAFPTSTNDPVIRRESVAAYLSRLDFTGQPALQIGPKATMTRDAFLGGYKYKRVQVIGEDRYTEKPDKNRYSHISDGCQYAFLGAFGTELIFGDFKSSKPLDYSRIDRAIV